MNTLAFIVGLVSLGLIKADVSHLQSRNQHHSGRTSFVANNGQLMKQAFNPFQNAGNDQNSKPFWWMNTETLPFTKTQAHRANENFDAGCNGCASGTLNIKHNTQQHNQIYQQQQPHYIQNPFINTKLQQKPYNSIHTHSAIATVSGSPSEVNSLFTQSNFNSGRIQQSSTCTDANSACVASAKFCYNGYIDQSAEQKAVRSTVSNKLWMELKCKKNATISYSSC